MWKLNPIFATLVMSTFAALACPGAVAHAPSAGRVPMSLHHDNPHIHGVHPESRAVDHKDKRPDRLHHREHWHSVWHQRWDYTTWIGVHRGLGTIVGTVRGSSGAPVAAVVNLRYPGGRFFRLASKKHVVYAGPGGSFVMTGVRAGRYRVVARMPGSKHYGHTQVSVHTGVAATVGIRL